MSAAALQPIPNYQDGLAYWDNLTLQCRRHVKAINAVLKDAEVPEDHLVSWKPGPLTVIMSRAQYPSTEVKLMLSFEHWGPKITAFVRGYQEEELRFYPEEFEFPIVKDTDDSAVSITPEGRSLSPHELAKYLAQNFRRCYSGVSLPCPETPLEQ
jgi:hypothetical protein